MLACPTINSQHLAFSVYISALDRRLEIIVELLKSAACMLR